MGMETMTSLPEFISWAKNKAKEYPHLREEILDLISLCEDEIEEGGSTEHEIQLAQTAIDQLIEGEDE